MKILEQGERLVWQSKAGGRAGYPQLVVIAVFLVMFFGLSSLCSLPIMVTAVDTGSIRSIFASLLNSLVCLVPMFGLIAMWAIPRLRPSFFLTDRDLVERKLWGSWERYPLAEVQAAERYVAVYHGRYGPRQVLTHRVALVLQSRTGNRRVLFGPTKDIDYLLDLLQFGVLSDYIDLSMLPAVDGAPGPAETRGDFFVCSRTRSDGFEYGPLFVGPHKIVRFTEELPAELLGRLYTELGRSSGPGEAEQAVMQIARSPSAGHYTESARDAVVPELDGTRLTLRGADMCHATDLDAKSADRLRGYLTLSRRAPDGR